MNAASALALFAGVVAALVAAGFYAAGVQARRVQQRDPPGLVRELTAALQRCEAEAARWRATAESLQRELDGRGAGG